MNDNDTSARVPNTRFRIKYYQYYQCYILKSGTVDHEVCPCVLLLENTTQFSNFHQYCVKYSYGCSRSSQTLVIFQIFKFLPFFFFLVFSIYSGI